MKKHNQSKGYATKNTTTVITNIVKSAVLALEKIEAAMGTMKYVSPATRVRGLKPRIGSDRIVEMIGALATAQGLDSPSLHSAGMLNQVAADKALAPLEAMLTKLLDRVTVARFMASTTAYGEALKFYALLQRMATSDPELAATITPIEEFFAHRHRLVLAGKPTKSETRAKKDLADAERRLALAKARAGATQTAEPHPAPHEDTAPQPVVKPVAVTPSPAIKTVPAPQTSVTNGAPSNGYTNGAATTGVTNGSG